MLGNPNYESFRLRFYQYRVHFKNFDAIRDDKKSEINDKIKYFKEKYVKSSFIEIYEEFLAFGIHNREFNFDEKVYMLINIFDPNLIAYNIYKETKFIKRSEIQKEDNDFVKQSLNEERTKQLEEYKSRVREEIGFIENDLPTFELAYYKKYINQGLIFGNSQNVTNELLDKVSKVDTLLINNDRIEEIKDIVKNYKSNYPKASLKDVFYQLTYQNKVLGLKTYSEIALFIIFYIDDKLLLSQIYFEESRIDVMRKRSKEEINFFHTGLIKLEELYVKEYLPDLYIERKLTWK